MMRPPPLGAPQCDALRALCLRLAPFEDARVLVPNVTTPRPFGLETLLGPALAQIAEAAPPELIDAWKRGRVDAASLRQCPLPSPYKLIAPKALERAMAPSYWESFYRKF